MLSELPLCCGTKKRYAPSITGQGISAVVPFKSMNLCRHYKYIFSYYNIQTYCRRTFSPTETYPVRQMMDIQVVCGGIKNGGDIYIFCRFVLESHMYYLYFCRWIMTLIFIYLFWRSFLSVIGWEALISILIGR